MWEKILLPFSLSIGIGLAPLLYQFIVGFTSVISYYVAITSAGIISAFFATKIKWSNTAKYKRTLLKLLQGTLVLHALYLIFITLARYYNLNSEVIDLSYYHITTWQLSEFHLPRIWDIPSRLVWGDHFEPILFLFVPFYWIIKDAVLLFFVQAIVVVSGIIPIYLITKEKLKNQFLGISLSFAYLFFGGLQMGYGYGFHPILFFPTLFFWTYYFLQKKKRGLYIFFLFLTLSVKEEVAFIVIAFGIYQFVIKKERKMSLITILMGIGWYILCFNIIFPYFSGEKGFGHLGQYGELGIGGISGLIKNIFLNPKLFLTTLITPSDKIDTFFHTLGSFSFLPFLYPPTLLFVLPSLLEKLLSSDIARLNGFHYSAAITGVIVISSIESLSYIFKKNLYRLSFLKNSYFWTVYILYIAIMANLLFGYKYFSFFSNKNTIFRWPQHIFAVYRIINLLPANASVSAQYQIAPHLRRPFLKILPAPNDNENSDYVILDLHLPLVLSTEQRFKNNLLNLLHNSKYKVIYFEDEVIVFKKSSH